MYKFTYERILSVLLRVYLGMKYAMSYGNSVFNFLMTCQNVVPFYIKHVYMSLLFVGKMYISILGDSFLVLKIKKKALE